GVLRGGYAARALPCGDRPEWRNGRRGGLKIRCPKGRVGSNPTSGTPSDQRQHSDPWMTQTHPDRSPESQNGHRGLRTCRCPSAAARSDLALTSAVMRPEGRQFFRVDRAASEASSLVGRRRELEALHTSLTAARGGPGRLARGGGDPGAGRPGIAQGLAGIALAEGVAVAWGRCLGAEGAPAFWPWRQVLRSLRVDPDAVLRGDDESPEDRFRLFDDVTAAVVASAGNAGLLVILDDVHWADEPSLLLLRHVAAQVDAARLLLLVSFRGVEPVSALPRVLPDLLRTPAMERLGLRGFGLLEVREQLAAAGVEDGAVDARYVLDLTGGNPLFVRE